MQTVREVRRILRAQWRWFIVLSVLWMAALAVGNYQGGSDSAHRPETPPASDASARSRLQEGPWSLVGVLIPEAGVSVERAAHQAMTQFEP